MNILIISPSNTIGGAELSLLENVKYLHKNNVKIVAVLPPDEKNQLGELLKPYCKKIYHQYFMRWIWNFSEHESWKDKLIGFAYYLKLSGGYFLSARKIAAIGKTHQVQLIHTNASSVIDGALAAKKMNIPHIYHVREIIGNHSLSTITYPFQFIPILFKHIMNRFNTHILFNSFFCFNAAIKYFPQEKCSVIYNGFHPSWYTFKRRRKEKTLTVATVANVTASWKNHSFVIKTAKELIKCYPNFSINFNIYGSLPPNENYYFVELKKLIEVNNLEKQIHFKGKQKSEDIYDHSDILLHPALKEAFGRIFIEAMGKGVPVVAVASGGASELIQHGETGFLVPPDAPEKAAELILELLNNPELYARIQQHAYTHAVNFSIEKTGQQLVRLYEQLIHAARS